MKKLLTTLPAVVFMSACGTDLSSQGAAVRQISLQGSEGCTFVGPVTGYEAFGLSAVHNAQSALNKVRNDVAILGGNAFVLSQTISDENGTVSHADAYRCAM